MRCARRSRRYTAATPAGSRAHRARRVLAGEVQVFQLIGHATADQCYAWSQLTGRERRVHAVLHGATLGNATQAVRAMIVARERTRVFYRDRGSAPRVYGMETCRRYAPPRVAAATRLALHATGQRSARFSMALILDAMSATSSRTPLDRPVRGPCPLSPLAVHPSQARSRDLARAVQRHDQTEENRSKTAATASAPGRPRPGRQGPWWRCRFM